MTRKLTLTALLVASVAVLLMVWLQDPAGIAIQWSAFRIAGIAATNCGYPRETASQNTIATANQCVMKAMDQHHGFRVTYQAHGRDSTITWTILTDQNGQLLTAGDDSMGVDPIVPLHPYLVRRVPMSSCATVVDYSYLGHRLICTDRTDNPVN